MIAPGLIDRRARMGARVGVSTARQQPAEGADDNETPVPTPQVGVGTGVLTDHRPIRVE
ncbi:hypothetical protein [Streptomyces sp. NBC_00986]|uniref:hypothetical protein n=1 Tax=Streptomyces sp. NBC_00986 TaxID=2903702 RepID=UPI003866EAF5|nr:hypothetical protein OG504_39515 [Streptomyces sp. NBC_00986]